MNVDPIALNANAQMIPELDDTRSRLSEQEVRVAGITSNNLITLRSMLVSARNGATFQTRAGTLQLTAPDAEAAISLLIERSEQYLTSLDIKLDREG